MGSHGPRFNSSLAESSCLPSASKSQNSRILHLLPCTVSQLMSATEYKDAFHVQGMEIKQVSLVGLVRRTKPSVAYVVYTLDDMTGPSLAVKQWMDLEDVNTNSCVIPPNTYIKVVGSLQSFQHHRSLVAFSIRRVEDLNEITSHMLEVVQAHLLNDNNSSSYSMKKPMTSVQIHSNASESSVYGFSPSQSQVFNLIKTCPLAEGISVQSLRTTLKNLSPYDIRNCLQFLINEGHIFSTVDDDHFKSTYY